MPRADPAAASNEHRAAAAAHLRAANKRVARRMESAAVPARCDYRQRRSIPRFLSSPLPVECRAPVCHAGDPTGVAILVTTCPSVAIAASRCIGDLFAEIFIGAIPNRASVRVEFLFDAVRNPPANPTNPHTRPGRRSIRPRGSAAHEDRDMNAFAPFRLDGPGDAVALPRPLASNGPWLALGAPALEAMTDFRCTPAITVPATTQVDVALERMIYSGVRLLFVVGADFSLLGSISSYDIQSEKPMLYLQSLGLSDRALLARGRDGSRHHGARIELAGAEPWRLGQRETGESRADVQSPREAAHHRRGTRGRRLWHRAGYVFGNLPGARARNQPRDHRYCTQLCRNRARIGTMTPVRQAHAASPRSRAHGRSAPMIRDQGACTRRRNA